MKCELLALAVAAVCGFALTASAEWITHPDMADLRLRNVLARQLERGKLAPVDARCRNRHYLFRRSFDAGDVKKAVLRITADDYYKLYVNGAFVGMGPAAGTVDCTYYNVIDLTPHLVRGRNTIAVHTYYQGLVNRVWVSGDNRHGLWLELDADGKRVLESDASFKVVRHTGYSAMGTAGYDTQFLECYDAGAPEVGFERPDFDDASWVSSVRHPLGGDYRLVEQPTPAVVTERIAPVRTERMPGGGLRIDFGGVYVGNVELAASGKRGGAVEIRCGQELNDDGSVRYGLRANCNYVERMVLSGGPRDVLSQFDYKSFRYLELIPSPDVTVDPGSVRLIARHQPFELKAKPSFADPELKPVWDLCVNSFRYGVQEQIMDCMEREKGYYLGDGCYTMLAYCQLTRDWRQARKFFDDFLRTRKVDRGLLTCANCSFMLEIAEYPFMMVLFARWYLDLTGDTDFVAERFAAFADVVDSYRERYAREDGLLRNLDKWCVVEWPKNFQDGYDADVGEGKVCTDMHNAINAWYVIAVKSLNAMAARLGRKPYADAGSLESSFRRVFWDAERHLFVDREGSRHVSLPGNVYATFARLAPKDDAAAHAAFLALVREKRYSSISMFQFFPIFCYLRETGESALLHELMVSPDAWLRNIREGGTRTFEGWGKDTKWNTSLFHLTIASAAVFMTDCELTLPASHLTGKNDTEK